MRTSLGAADILHCIYSSTGFDSAGTSYPMHLRSHLQKKEEKKKNVMSTRSASKPTYPSKRESRAYRETISRTADQPGEGKPRTEREAAVSPALKHSDPFVRFQHFSAQPPPTNALGL